jgi:hypothetical protein
LKIKWKSKKVIGGLFSVILLAFGVANPEIVAGVATDVTCAAVTCDA